MTHLLLGTAMCGGRFLATTHRIEPSVDRSFARSGLGVTPENRSVRQKGGMTWVVPGIFLGNKHFGFEEYFLLLLVVIIVVIIQ